MRAFLLVAAALLGCSSQPAAEPSDVPLSRAGAAGSAGTPPLAAGSSGESSAGGAPSEPTAGAPDDASAPPEAGGKPAVAGTGGSASETKGGQGGASAGAPAVGGSPARGGDGGSGHGGAPSGGAPAAGTGGVAGSLGGTPAGGSSSAGMSAGGATARPEDACPGFTLYRVPPGACLRADGDYDVVGAVTQQCSSIHETSCQRSTNTGQCAAGDEPYCDGADLLVYVKGQTLGTTYVVHLYDDSPDNPVANCRCN